MTQHDQAAGPDEPGRALRLAYANTVQMLPVEWLWEDEGHGRIPIGALTLTAGREGTGKSSFSLWLAAKVTNGTLPGKHFGRPKTVLVVATEDDTARTIVPRLVAAGADLARVAFPQVSENGTPVAIEFPGDVQRLEEAAADAQAALIVVDPLSSTIGNGRNIDTHKERDVRLALEPLVRLAQHTGAAVLGVAHFNKGSSSDAANLITGSGAFKNVARAVLAFAKAETGERVFTQVKNSLGGDDLPSLNYTIESTPVRITPNATSEVGRFRFIGVAAQTVSDILRTRVSDEMHSELGDAANWLADYLTMNGKTPSKTVKGEARKQGFAERTAQRARESLNVIVTSEGMPRTTHWQLPPIVPSAGESQTLGTTGTTESDKGEHLVQQPPPLQSCQGVNTGATDGATGNLRTDQPTADPPDITIQPADADPPNVLFEVADHATCATCGQALSYPASRERGTCERCYRAGVAA